MGKIRRKTLRAKTTVDPLAAALFAETERPFEDDLEQTEGPVSVIKDQLQSVNVEEKINGLQALATYAGNKDKIMTICNSDIIRIAAPLLCERDLSVRSAAAGALRNFSVCGTEVCNILVQQDVPTPLLALLSEYVLDAQWTPTFDAKMQGEMDLRSDVFLHAINLLWNLCESNSMALDQLNQTVLLEGFIRYLEYNIFGLDIAISVAQCLLVVSENNVKCWNILNEHANSFLYLMSITGEHGYAFLRALAAAIISNVPALAAAHTVPILQSLAMTLQDNQIECIETLLSAVETLNDTRRETELSISDEIITDDETEESAALRRRKNELPTQKELVLRNLSYMLDSQRVAAEVATNLLCEEDEEWEDNDADEEDDDAVLIMDYDGKNGNGNISEMDKLSADVLEVIKSSNLVHKFWERAKPLPEHLIQRIRQHDVTMLSKVKYLRYSTLLCLQNMCNILSTEDLGGVTFLYNMWLELGQLIFKAPQDTPELLEPSTALMRAALEHLKTKKELFSQMSADDLQLILNGVKVCSMSEIRANWLRMLGNLGCLLTEDLTQSTISFLLESCSREDDAWTMSEVLDVLMDMFADNDWTQIVRNLNLAKHLKELDKIFKAKVRQQRRELNERYAAVRTVQQNLPRFIKYIEKEANKV